MKEYYSCCYCNAYVKLKNGRCNSCDFDISKWEETLSWDTDKHTHNI